MPGRYQARVGLMDLPGAKEAAQPWDMSLFPKVEEDEFVEKRFSKWTAFDVDRQTGIAVSFRGYVLSRAAH